MLLENAGHTVVSALGADTVQYACKSGKFDVAVIGQGATKAEKQQFMEQIRIHCPTARVLELYVIHSQPALTEADDHLEVPSDAPSDLVERVDALAKRPATGASVDNPSGKGKLRQSSRKSQRSK